MGPDAKSIIKFLILTIIFLRFQIGILWNSVNQRALVLWFKIDCRNITSFQVKGSNCPFDLSNHLYSKTKRQCYHRQSVGMWTSNSRVRANPGWPLQWSRTYKGYTENAGTLGFRGAPWIPTSCHECMGAIFTIGWQTEGCGITRIPDGGS